MSSLRKSLQFLALTNSMSALLPLIMVEDKACGSENDEAARRSRRSQSTHQWVN